MASTVAQSRELLSFLLLQFPHLNYTNFFCHHHITLYDKSLVGEICKSYISRYKPKLNSLETLQCKSFNSVKFFVRLTDGHGLSYWRLYADSARRIKKIYVKQNFEL